MTGLCVLFLQQNLCVAKQQNNDYESDLIFTAALVVLCVNGVHYCEDRFHNHFLNRSSHICFLCIEKPLMHHFTGLLRTNTMTSSQLAC